MEQTSKPEEQVKQLEEKFKAEIENTTIIPLKQTQIAIFTKLINDKAILNQEFQKLIQKESELLAFCLEFANIDQKGVEKIEVSPTNDSLIVKFKQSEMKLQKEKPLNVNGNNNIIGDNNKVGN